MNNMADVI